MNNIILLKEYDPGTGRMRKPGQQMRVDKDTATRLIEEGIAQRYEPETRIVVRRKESVEVEVPAAIPATGKVATEKNKSKTAKAQEVKSPAAITHKKQ